MLGQPRWELPKSVVTLRLLAKQQNVQSVRPAEEDIEAKTLSQCKKERRVPRHVKEEIARSQGKNRWIVCGWDNLLYIQQIKKELPQAKFIHIIRDVALSLHKEQWICALPCDYSQGLLVAAIQCCGV